MFTGPNMANDGLVFYYDTGNTRKSFKGEPTVNLSVNPSGASISNDIPGNFQPGWDSTLHSDALVVNSWGSGYNAGVPSPEIGYHAKWIFAGIDGGPCMFFNDTNNQFSLGHRWLGISQNTVIPQDMGLIVGDKFTISWLQKSTNINKGANVGLYHTESGVWTFNGTQQTINATSIMEWERVSITAEITSAWDLDQVVKIYVYGHYGDYGKLWVDDVQLEQKPHPTPFTPNTRTATESLLDLTGNSTIDVSNAGFDSNAEIVFDGVDEGLILSDFQGFNGEQEATIEFWVQRNSSSSNGHVIWFNPGVLVEYTSGSTIRVRWYQNIVDTYGSTFYITGVEYSSTEHIIVTYNAGQIQMFLQGELITTGTDQGDTLTGIPSTKELMLRTGLDAVDGKLPITKIYNKALTPLQVKQNFNALKSRFGL